MKLNLGAGRHQLLGFVNVDLKGSEFDCDLGVFPWPFEDRSASEIVASHVLEHFTRQDGARFLRECARILQSGGVLHVAVPDMDRFIDARLTGDYTPLEGYRWTSLNDLLGGGAAEENPAYRHRYMYCLGSLEHALGAAGFVTSGVRSYPAFWDNPEYRAISLYVDAIR